MDITFSSVSEKIFKGSDRGREAGETSILPFEDWK